MARTNKRSRAAYVKAITDSGGVLITVAKRLGVDRHTVYRRVKEDQELLDMIAQEKEKLKDFAESKIMEMIRDGNATMLIFFAKTQMKDRGYVERQEVTGGDGRPMVVEIVWPENGTANGSENGND